MTIADAIKIIEGAKTEAEWEKSLEYQIAFEMAIEALKGNERFSDTENGNWKKGFDNGTLEMRCSECGAAVWGVKYALAVGGYGWRHCPYCGVKMENAGDYAERPWPMTVWKEFEQEERAQAGRITEDME